jgi:glycosyltransferase involved in cell wall biosynthesis
MRLQPAAAHPQESGLKAVRTVPRNALAWHLITGEYPPQNGGVSDYTRILARELAGAGDRVEVWAPFSSAPDSNEEGVAVHRLPGRFGPRALVALDAALSRNHGRILVQYVPHGFGFKAMNFPFVFWLYARRRRLDISVMFHEVAFPMGWSRPLRHNLLGASHRVMAATLARSARRVFVATDSWERQLHRWLPQECPIVCLPVVSNVPVIDDREAIAGVRRRYQAGARPIIGHFGTCSGGIAALLDEVVPSILDQVSGASMLLIGRGGAGYHDRLLGRCPRFEDRLHAVGGLSERDASVHISACDLMLQPYPDGITTRRGSAMAPLSHGVAVATTAGHLTESLWAASESVAISPVSEPATLASIAAGLLNDEAARLRFGMAGRKLYEDRFHIRHTIEALRRCA